jgi:hypothetical protein
VVNLPPWSEIRKHLLPAIAVLVAALPWYFLWHHMHSISQMVDRAAESRPTRAAEEAAERAAENYHANSARSGSANLLPDRDEYDEHHSYERALEEGDRNHERDPGLDRDPSREGSRIFGRNPVLANPTHHHGPPGARPDPDEMARLRRKLRELMRDSALRAELDQRQLMRDSLAIGESHTPAADPVARALAALHPGEFQLRSPSTMTQATPVVVTLQISKDDTLAHPRITSREVVRQGKTHVGDSAQACLEGGDDFDIHHAPGGDKCYTQVVVEGADNIWKWRVTPKTAGDSLLLMASVKALLAGAPGRTIYSDTISIKVAVKACPVTRAECIGTWLTTLQGILTAIAAIGTVVFGWIAWLRSRVHTGNRKPRAIDRLRRQA